MERSSQWLPAIPAKEMIERGVPSPIVPFAMFAGRFVAGLGLALGVFPRWSALLLLAGGWHTTISGAVEQFL